jgi:ABC-type oligopeptide transport system substrate-binding subunit
MPFFQATSTKLPLTKEVSSIDGVDDLPTAGPYAFSLNRVNEETRIVRNPYWKPGLPGHHRPRNLAGVSITWNVDEQTGYLQTLDNEYDEGPLPSAQVQEVAQRFGVNRTRFWTEPIPCVGYVAFNNSQGLFANNPQLRKAVNWALDRTDYVAQAGPYAGQPWTHILPPGMPGSITAPSRQPYSPTANLARARKLAAGHFRNGKIVVMYLSTGTINPNLASTVRRDLIRLGFEPENITMTGFYPEIYYWPPPTHWDLYASSSWCADYPDPSDFFRSLVLAPAEVSPLHFGSAKYRRKIDAASSLYGNARYRAFGKVDLEMMRNAAPVAPMRTYNNRYLFSDRVDPRSIVFQPVYDDWSIPALALK